MQRPCRCGGTAGAIDAALAWSPRSTFATEMCGTGQPLNPNTDYHEWKQLLRDAGLREARLHDARHTAATVLLALQQPTPTVMSLMGWSSESMAARYQHVTDAMRTEVASQVGDLIWQPGEPGPDPAAVLVRRNSLATVLAFAQEHANRRCSAELRPRSLISGPRCRAERQPRQRHMRQKLRLRGQGSHDRS